MGIDSESYQPNEDEIKEAASQMTEKQEQATFWRERVQKFMDEYGMSNDDVNEILALTSSEAEEDQGGSKLEGTLSGHKIVLENKDGNDSGTVDGKELDPIKAGELRQLYAEIRHRFKSEKLAGDTARTDFERRDLPGYKGAVKEVKDKF